jgi:5,10-methylene-tetrahydrofolate dehydrogenase/methenyl tetrahydrofolate cyclohydrolase
MRDLASNIGVAATLVPATQAATLKGTAVDLRDYDSAALVINTGAIVGAGLYVMSMQESATTTDGDFTDVAAENMVGALPVSLAASTTYKVSYVGTKRFIRAVITKTSGTSIDAGAVVVLGRAHRSPVA